MLANYVNRYPKAIVGSISVVGVLLIGAAIHNMSPDKPVVEPPKPTVVKASDIPPVPKIPEPKIELKIVKPEKQLPEIDMERFARNLCEQHGGHVLETDDKNPCLDPVYLKRQAVNLTTVFQPKIQDCFALGGGNACLDPKTYQETPTEPIEDNRGAGRRWVVW